MFLLLCEDPECPLCVTVSSACFCCSVVYFLRFLAFSCASMYSIGFCVDGWSFMDRLGAFLACYCVFVWAYCYVIFMAIFCAFIVFLCILLFYV